MFLGFEVVAFRVGRSERLRIVGFAFAGSEDMMGVLCRTRYVAVRGCEGLVRQTLPDFVGLCRYCSDYTVDVVEVTDGEDKLWFVR